MIKILIGALLILLAVCQSAFAFSLLWEKPLEKGEGKRAMGELVVAEGKLFYRAGTYSFKAKIHALDAKTGKHLWAGEHYVTTNDRGMAYSSGVVSAAFGTLRDDIDHPDPGNAAMFGYAAFSAQTGTTLWRKYFPTAGLGSIMVAEGPSLYVLEDGSVQKVRAADGNFDWQFSPCERDDSGRLLTADLPPSRHEACKYSPVFYGVALSKDGLFVESFEGVFYRLDKESGKIAWATLSSTFSFDSWAMGLVEKGKYFVGNGDGNFYAHDATTGKMLWKAEASTDSAPVSLGGKIFINDGWYPGEMDSPPAKRIIAIDEESGSIAWKKPMKVASGGCIFGGLLFVGSEEGILYGLDPATGEEKYRFKVKKPIHEAPVTDGERLYVKDSEGSIYCFTK